MRIYSMTATFGKLEHETLNLQENLNVIQAPNEWGKSTWCAFLVAMLYGLETRAKSTKTALADKDRYAPWSGSPMAGRIDLNWKGRDITIERKTKGRVPMGEFRAYETATGLPVAELNATNCGQELLGVERSVFLRSGFIRLSDLPVTNDEALRRRLNALVTTGDESSAGDRLAKGLKDLKNRVRYNRSGLLPQLEGECAALEDTLREITTLQERMGSLGQRLVEISERLEKLENHKLALAFAAAEEDARRVAQARELRDAAGQHLQEMDAICAALPDREQLHWGLAKIAELEQSVEALDMETQMFTGEVEMPEVPSFARGLDPEKVLEKAQADAENYEKLSKKKPTLVILGILLVLAGAGAAYWYLIPGAAAATVGLVLVLAGWISGNKRKAAASQLLVYYNSGTPEKWVTIARAYKTAMEQATVKQQHQRQMLQNIENRREELEIKITKMTQGKGLRTCKADWQQALTQWDALTDAQRDWQRAESQLATVKAMAKTAKAPAFPDTLSYSSVDTERLLAEGRAELRQTETRLSQYAGRVEALGDPESLKKQLSELYARGRKLEGTYMALSAAQDALTQARQELQRKFAPRISSRAGELMAKMTEGRYDRFQLAEDFSLLAGADQEDTLHEAMWRSAGTLDQLYLSLRLAVAEALAPNAPLILDDALVRFDDVRLNAAMQILKEESDSKQVILFTCQNREKDVLKQQE